MSDFINKILSEKQPIEITDKKIRQLEILTQSFEMRNQHAKALNTPTLGINKIYFTDKDITDIFDIFNLDKSSFKKTINTISSINKEFKVISDPFNIVITWIAHNILQASSIADKVKIDGLTALFKMFYYRFFTSAVNHYLIYKPNEEMMLLTFSELNNKYDIVKYGTWKKVIEAKSIELTESTNLHYKTFYNYNNDDKILYIISDCSTRIRLQLQRFIEAFNEIRSTFKNDAIGQSLLVTGDSIDGGKFIRNVTNTIDNISNSMIMRILNQEEFINHTYVNELIKQFKAIRSDSFIKLLQYIINTALEQARTQHLDDTKTISQSKNEYIYIGIRIFIKEFVQKTYRYCINNGVNMNNKRSIYLAVSNAYRSSRIQDQNLLNVKESIAYLINNSGLTIRRSTLANYKICLLIYLLRLSFDDLN
jgi:hypothetical protein